MIKPTTWKAWLAVQLLKLVLLVVPGDHKLARKLIGAAYGQPFPEPHKSAGPGPWSPV